MYLECREELAMHHVDQKSSAIGLCLNDLAFNGYRHGPVIRAEAIGSSEADVWEVELAYEGQIGRCPTSDPPSILLHVNTATGDVQCVDLM
jgi:hypothetical protein